MKNTFHNIDAELLKTNKVPNNDVKIYKISFELLSKCAMPDIVYKENGKKLVKNPYI